jgi:ferredoxin
MTKYKIILDRDTCIGAFSCVAVGGGEEIWEMDDADGKVNLKLNGEELKKTDALHEVIIEDEDMAKRVVETGEVCPVVAIKVINMDTNEDMVK